MLYVVKIPSDETHTNITQPNVDDKLDTVLTKLTAHANEITSVLHDIQRNEYGKWSREINGNEWTIKHDEGDVEWLRQTTDNEERYVISNRDTQTR